MCVCMCVCMFCVCVITVHGCLGINDQARRLGLCLHQPINGVERDRGRRDEGGMKEEWRDEVSILSETE